MIHYSECPVCGSKKISPVLKVKDYTVSGEVYEIWNCDFCSLRFTQDVPGPDAIKQYYQSDAYISHSDTQEGIVNKLYHIVRSRALKDKKILVEKESGISKGAILDIGAGTGSFLHTMKQSGWQVKGLEPDEKARENSRQFYNLVLDPSENIFELIENSFDAITMWHVLEHVHELNKYISTIYRLLKPGGVLLVAVPNYTSPDAIKYKANWAAYDVPRHLYHFSPKSMTLLMEKHGFAVTKTLPMKFDSFYVSMLSEQYGNNKFGFIRGAISGLFSNIAASEKKKNYSSQIYVVKKLADLQSQ